MVMRRLSMLQCAPMRCWTKAIPKDFLSGAYRPCHRSSVAAGACRPWNQSIRVRLIASVAATIGLLAGSAGPAAAWGAEGHDIVAHIAAARLSPETRHQLVTLLDSASAEALAAAANWADEVRHERSVTAPWHYVN